MLEAAPVTLSKKNWRRMCQHTCEKKKKKKKKETKKEEDFLEEKKENSPMTYWPGSASTCDHPPQKKKTKWNLEAKSVIKVLK